MVRLIFSWGCLIWALLIEICLKVGCERIVKHVYQTAEVYVAWALAFLNMFQLVTLILSLYLVCLMFYDIDYNYDEDPEYQIEEIDQSANTGVCEKIETKTKKHGSKTRSGFKNFLFGSIKKTSQKRARRGHVEDMDDESNDTNQFNEHDHIRMTSYYI